MAVGAGTRISLPFRKGFHRGRRSRSCRRHQGHGFPFLLGGAFIEALRLRRACWHGSQFPFLFGRAFIEAWRRGRIRDRRPHFPSCFEGLSLRTHTLSKSGVYQEPFYPTGGTFIEAHLGLTPWWERPEFPFLSGRAFIEANGQRRTVRTRRNFRAFSQGLSLRPLPLACDYPCGAISSLSSGDFH